MAINGSSAPLRRFDLCQDTLRARQQSGKIHDLGQT
jgi:hypothetical protein